MAAALRAQGLPERFSAEVGAPAAGIATGALSGTTPAVRELTGFPPRTFSQFRADHAIALRQEMSGATS